jgi:hypothetical protein
MSSISLTDAWECEVTVSNGLFRYRNRAIDVLTFSDIRVKGKRVLINNFKENSNLPRANIICKDPETAKAIYDYILESVYPHPLLQTQTQTQAQAQPFTLWSFLGCSRHSHSA